MDIYLLISISGAVQGFFIFSLFYLKRNKHSANNIFALYVLIFSFGLLEQFAEPYTSSLPGSILYSFLGFSNFLYGPLLFLFVRCLSGFSIRPARVILHFLPFIIGWIADMLLILNSGTSIRNGVEPVEFVIFELLVIHLLLYNILALKTIKKYKRYVLQTYSGLSLKDIKWVQFLVTFTTVIYITSFTITHLIVFGVLDTDWPYLLVQVLIAYMLYLVSYRMYLFPSLFELQLLPLTVDESIEEEPVRRYEKSGLKVGDAEMYRDQLMQFMKAAKPYKNPGLTVFDLAREMGISRNHLTEILNIHVGHKFHEFINSYRVEEAKELLKTPGSSALNMAGIGLEAGFRSKSAFYTHFKKATGYTPNEWKNNNCH